MQETVNRGEIVTRTPRLVVCWNGSGTFEVWATEDGLPVKHLYTFHDADVKYLQAARERAQEWVADFGWSTGVLLDAEML